MEKTSWFVSYKYGNVFGAMVIDVPGEINPNANTIGFLKSMTESIENSCFTKPKEGRKPVVLFYKRAY